MTLAHILNQTKKILITLIGGIFILYFALILASYSVTDPSWTHLGKVATIDNLGGATGAWIADFAYTFLGKAVWVLLYIVLYEVLLVWFPRKLTVTTFKWRIVAYFFLLLVMTATFSMMNSIGSDIVDKTTGKFIMPLTHSVADNLLADGGIIGYELTIRLQSLLTETGTWLFLLVLILVTATFSFNIRWKQIWYNLVRLKYPNYKIEQEIAEEEAEKAKEAEAKAKEKKKQKEKTIIRPRTISRLAKKVDKKQDDKNNDKAKEEFIIDLATGEKISKENLQTEMTAKQETITQANVDEVVPALKPFQYLQQLQYYYVSPYIEQYDEQAQEAEEKVTVETAQATKEPTSKKVLTESIEKQKTAEEKIDKPIKIAEPLEQKIDKQQQAIYEQQQAVASVQEFFEEIEKPNYQPEPEPTTAIVEEVQQVVEEPQEVATNENYGLNFHYEEEKRLAELAELAKNNLQNDNLTSGLLMDYEDNSLAKSKPTLPNIADDDAFKGKSRAFQTAIYRKSLTDIPSLDVLDKPDPNQKPSYSEEELQQLSALLEIKLQDFNIKADVVNAIPGPVVTRFEVELAPGIKASKVVGISRDLARSLSMASLRVVEIIPGKPYIGIEVPNHQREMVRLIELLDTDSYRDPSGQISMAMGKNIGGEPIITDLAKAPHMLVAGTTGSGKSVLVNSMLLSMLLKYTPNELRLILIDPKQLELANYNDIPHLLTPVVTDMTEAAGALSWCVAEMERRYQLMSLLRVRKLKEFNKAVIEAEKAGKPIIDPLWRPNDSVSVENAPKLEPLPMIVIVADEFADMIMQVGKQAEELITRLAQKSRASGIHLMLATQRPSVDVITGLIKANIPARVALRVNSKIDSRTILDAGGAEDMLGNGDMLFLGPGQIESERVHGAFVSDDEVNRVCEAWRERGAPEYIDNFTENFQITSSDNASSGGTSGEDDAFYNEAVAFVLETRKVSASSIQRKFSIGYNRAARIVDSMEEAGIVSPMIRGKREILV